MVAKRVMHHFEISGPLKVKEDILCPMDDENLVV